MVLVAWYKSLSLNFIIWTTFTHLRKALALGSISLYFIILLSFVFTFVLLFGSIFIVFFHQRKNALCNKLFLFFPTTLYMSLAPLFLRVFFIFLTYISYIVLLAGALNISVNLSIPFVKLISKPFSAI